MPNLPIIEVWQTQSDGVDAFSMENEELTMKN